LTVQYDILNTQKIVDVSNGYSTAKGFDYRSAPIALGTSEPANYTFDYTLTSADFPQKPEIPIWSLFTQWIVKNTSAADITIYIKIWMNDSLVVDYVSSPVTTTEPFFNYSKSFKTWDSLVGVLPGDRISAKIWASDTANFQLMELTVIPVITRKRYAATIIDTEHKIAPTALDFDRSYYSTTALITSGRVFIADDSSLTFPISFTGRLVSASNTLETENVVASTSLTGYVCKFPLVLISD
jgi:hypothetical protein